MDECSVILVSGLFSLVTLHENFTNKALKSRNECKCAIAYYPVLRKYEVPGSETHKHRLGRFTLRLVLCTQFLVKEY